MELITLFGYLGALLIGVVLGLVGGGGSILTVPILVYLFHLNPVLATAYSLFIVGITALVGTIRNFRKGIVDVKIGTVFAIPAFIAVYATRKYLLPAIPEVLYASDNLELSKDLAIMLFFALIMMMAAYSMIKKKKHQKDEVDKTISLNIPLIVIEGIVVGVLTGLVGAGGGFLIIPALVVLAKMPMKKAVATSLLIITVKSLIGFTGDLGNFEIDWNFLLLFSLLSIVGIFIGGFMNNWIDGKKLKSAFGWFVILMAVYIILKELY